MNLILASSSPRRQELLKQIGLTFNLRIQEADESQIKEKDPIKKVKHLAKLKADSTPVYDEELVITADTIVALEDRIFEKPKDTDEAFLMLKALSGTCHQVHTSVVLKTNFEEKQILNSTDVYFYDLKDEEILDYIHSDEPYDKAGGYGIQSIGAKFVKEIRGDYNTIVGLPIAEVYQLLNHW